MVTVAGTVEGAGFNTGSLGLFGKTRANELGSGNVATAARDVRELSTHFGSTVEPKPAYGRCRPR